VVKKRSLTSWVVPFGVGLAIGLLIDFALRIGGALSIALVAIPFGAAAITVIGSLLAEVFKESLREDADRRRRMELHVQSLSENALAYLPSLVWVSDLWARERRQDFGICIEGPSGNYSIERLNRWRYAEDHILQDRDFGPKWQKLTDQTTKRQELREKLRRIHDERVEAVLASEFGPGWVVGSGFESPQPRRWYNAEVIWNWVRSRRALGRLTDRETQMNYGRADIPPETRFDVTSESGGMSLLSSTDGPEQRAERLTKIILGLQADTVLRRLQDEIESGDRDLLAEVGRVRVEATEFYERTAESKQISGRCPVCP
jgi:hypothetical protein